MENLLMEGEVRWVMNPDAARDELKAFVRMYLDTYCDTQARPTPSQEAAVMMKARTICQDFNFGAD